MRTLQEHRPPLAVVIPALNAAAGLPGVIAALDRRADDALLADLLVVDGGSADATVRLAERAGARVLAAPRGRGMQLAAGAAATAAPWLLFLHADTRLGEGWRDAVAGFLAAPGSEGRAAAFRFRLDDDAPAARRLEKIVGWRCRLLGLPYGDQGLLIARTLYAAVGGFRPLPLMEDVDLVRRLGRRRMALLRADAVTSAARYRRDGYLARSARNLACLSLWFLGTPPATIRRLYG